MRYSAQKHFHMSIPPRLALAAIYPNQGAVASRIEIILLRFESGEG